MDDEDLSIYSWLTDLYRWKCCSGCIVNRRWGWSPRGFLCRVRSINIRSKKHNILSALSKDGYIVINIFQGFYILNRFEFFIFCYVLFRIYFWPLFLSVLVVDNCSIYNEQVISLFKILFSMKFNISSLEIVSAYRTVQRYYSYTPSLLTRFQPYRRDISRVKSLYTKKSSDGEDIWRWL